MWLYLRKEVIDQYKVFLFGTGALVAGCCLFGLIAFISANPYRETFELADMMPLYMTLLLAFTALMASRSFNQLSKPERSIDFFLLPASHLEKFLAQLIISMLAVIVVFNLAIFIGVQFFSYLATHYKNVTVSMDFDRFFPGPFSVGIVLLMVAGINSIFLFGATFFHKFALPKIFFLFIVIMMGIWALNIGFTNLIFAGHIASWNASAPFSVVGVIEPGSTAGHQLSTGYFVPEWLGRPLLFIAKYLLTPALWTMAYFRIADKEIQ